jgi:hypothetical protein
MTWLRTSCTINLQDSDSDPLVRGTDPRIRIRTKKSRIHIFYTCIPVQKISSPIIPWFPLEMLVYSGPKSFKNSNTCCVTLRLCFLVRTEILLGEENVQIIGEGGSSPINKHYLTSIQINIAKLERYGTLRVPVPTRR